MALKTFDTYCTLLKFTESSIWLASRYCNDNKLIIHQTFNLIVPNFLEGQENSIDNINVNIFCICIDRLDIRLYYASSSVKS